MMRYDKLTSEELQLLKDTYEAALKKTIETYHANRDALEVLIEKVTLEMRSRIFAAADVTGSHGAPGGKI